MSYTVLLDHKDIYWVVEKLHNHYYVKDVRDVVRFISTKAKNEEIKDQFVFDKPNNLTYHLPMSRRYKNISKQEHMIPGVGLFKPGEEFPSEVEINNTNFTLINADIPQNVEMKGDSPTLPKSV